MKITYIFLLLFLIQTLRAQESNPANFFVGYGYYEGFNLGHQYSFKSGMQSIGMALGYHQSKHGNKEYFAITISYNYAVFKNYYTNKGYKWHVSNRAILWKLSDDYYLWKCLAFTPSICRKIHISENMAFSIDAGPLFNVVLYNKRKTFEEVGWPYWFMPNIRILCIF